MMPAPEYVAARRVLLDALGALHDHLDNLILVGAQAVYLHTDAAREQRLHAGSAEGKEGVDERSEERTGDGTLNVPPMTTDADLALNTARLAAAPEIAHSLISAGFSPSTNPGHWLGAMDVAIDIMVVPYQAGTTSKTARAARIPPHAKNVGRIAPGLEPALIDNTVHDIGALEDDDPRGFRLRVANPAALLIAKAVKIAEREDDARRQPERLKTKDALDLFRLLQTIDTDVLVAGLRSHQSEPEAARVSTQGIAFVAAEGTRPNGLLPQLAAQAAFGDPTIAPAFAALTNDLLNTLG
jgi:hypothetical protein